MRISKPHKGEVGRTLGAKKIEEKLDQILRRSGETALQEIRDEAKKIGSILGMEKETKKLDDLIGALLGTRDFKLHTKSGIARNIGNPYDPDHLNLFEILYRFLQEFPPQVRLAPEATEILAFYEAYFSNFIEGTEFAVNEAEEIVFEGKIPNDRSADAHDVVATYRIVSSLQEMKKIPKSFEEFLILLKTRHSIIMSERPEKLPGQFKELSNSAGATLFVDPELVQGTLRKGFELYSILDGSFQRAVFMMFLVAEVHPFVDGNGRIARIMMNAELIAKGEQRIIIPTIYRNNYLMSLKTLSHNYYPEALVRTLDFAQRYTAKIDWNDKDTSQKILKSTNAFVDPYEADLYGIRLILPNESLITEAKEGI
jgi:hypothetical protein